MCFDGFCLECDNWGPWEKKSPENSTTPILHIVNIQMLHNTYSTGMNECGQKHTYYGIDFIGMLPWFGTEAQ